MQLRNWQLECSNQAVDSFSLGQKHFLALATPGSGKTIMAAHIAKQLFENNMIDYVICFAPSVAVTNSMRTSFAHVLRKPMHGYLGAAGGVFTYQYLASSKKADWSFLKKSRVLVVFDEIHHCGGDDTNMANAWGREVLLNIKQHANYMLSMTGTPWRTDMAPITLASYLEPDMIIQCDYTYGITSAIRDKVCRTPEVILIDNDKLQVNAESFGSLQIALEQSSLRYSEILTDDNAVRYLLSKAVQQLKQARIEQPNAGGLVVARSVEHAKHIMRMLRKDFNQSAVLVTYMEPAPQDVIEQFRTSNTQWIVSVSMVSEGTDIPRLRVCAHLSMVRTELFFRQVLGRILRMMPNIRNNKAWLFSFAERSLLEYAQQLQQDIPESIIKYDSYKDIFLDTKPTGKNPLKLLPQPNDIFSGTQLGDWAIKDNPNDSDTSITQLLFSLQGRYRQQVFSIF
ncbi:DEAD/DEAH box helicase [Rheinheimera salexigens]|uniref:Helicase ATP-binding domain-containing protein n=1 Tax=Rheinheimera salexigens TaxID=1628148 RepID=A0A1E7Q439_9GAMM|nr:DEAD/DEAH box helicase family protein [Rheinheimera salexigens]OEY68818.1 hypothetical protein BI198_04000 [Rheinheimera salexigens]